MIKLSVLSEGRSRFGVVSKYINRATMANYAVVEWDIHDMNGKQIEEVIARLEFISTLRHQRIGSVYGYHVTDSRLLIFRTFLPTGAVADLLKVAPLPEERAKKFFRQALEALEFLHERNVTHGDIKNAPKPDKHKRRTLLHCAPEMFRTMDAWGNASAEGDVWAVGCVLVTMVTRYSPFQDLFLSLSTQKLHETLFEAHRRGSSSHLSYTSRTLIPSSSQDMAEMVDATFVEDPMCRPTAAELLQRFFAGGASRKTSRISEPSLRARSSVKRETIEHNDLYNDGPTSLVADPAHKNLLERLYESAEKRSDDEGRPLLFCMKWYGSRILILLLLFLKWVGMVFLAALSLGFVAGSVFLSIYVIYKGIGVVCQCQLNEGFIVLIALILLPIIILLTTLCVNNSCEKYKQAQEDGSMEKCRYVYPRPEDDIILCGIIVVDGRKEERKISVRRKVRLGKLVFHTFCCELYSNESTTL
ncbi:hypothetical protein OESDEN_13167 [Oesophagostomum dentatum]|uniref:Protein kinase domain-containing protein n=1 Tax=Oesophagostomum dentatum TaxID=61180 RepID=A0A0B1ST52_OESDE|nr:hypothetical protein OESDEN_13167 [Oesophagostomum dentatum]